MRPGKGTMTEFEICELPDKRCSDYCEKIVFGLTSPKSNFLYCADFEA